VSLVEVLISAALGSIALVAVAQFFATQARVQLGHGYRIEQDQALRASLDNVTRDLRLAGACLPVTGGFIALAGTDGPGPDTVTARAGIVRNDLSCVVTALSALVSSGSQTVPVTSGTGFVPDMLVYLRHPGGSGQFTFVDTATATTVSLTDATLQDYPVGTGLFAVDERVYQVDASGSTPRLTLSVDRAAPENFAAGLRDFQVRYVLQQNCPPCDVVDLPADDATWRLVNEVIVTARAETVNAVRPEDQVTVVETSRAKPRNLLP
jgi:Tfp pilus assembly protein PilW